MCGSKVSDRPFADTWQCLTPVHFWSRHRDKQSQLKIQLKENYPKTKPFYMNLNGVYFIFIQESWQQVQRKLCFVQCFNFCPIYVLGLKVLDSIGPQKEVLKSCTKSEEKIFN